MMSSNLSGRTGPRRAMRYGRSALTGLALAALAVSTTAVPARAQGGVNISPWAGVYIPTKNSLSDLDNAAFKRDVSVIGGARLTFWGTGMLGLEATGGYAPARVSGETINETNTNLAVGNVRLLLALSPVTNSVGFYVGAGPALLARGKNPLDDDRSRTDIGGTVGAGLRFALGESGNSALRVDLEDYLYNGDFGGGDDFQNDLVASLGLSIALGGSAGK
ncbi:MAG TPA: outer membrane beta-barrel protein [Gemmatimonadales bacterium]